MLKPSHKPTHTPHKADLCHGLSTAFVEPTFNDIIDSHSKIEELCLIARRLMEVDQLY